MSSRSSPATPVIFSFPKDFAAPATLATKRQIEDLKRKRAEREAAELNAAQELSGKLGKLKLVFTLAAGEGQEKSFGSVTNQDIATKLKEAGYEIDRKKIDLPKPIKDTGEHEVPVKLAPGCPSHASRHGESPRAERERRERSHGREGREESSQAQKALSVKRAAN